MADLDLMGGRMRKGISETGRSVVEECLDEGILLDVRKGPRLAI